MSNKIRILVVDDNSINRQYFLMSLTKSGFNVVTAESGIKAIEHANTTSFDLILMDIRMPDMDGFETTKLIRQLKMHNHTPIIATSAEHISAQDKLLFNDFLLKPISPKQLNHIVQKYCKNCLSPALVFNQKTSLDYAYNDKNIMNKLINMFLNELDMQLNELKRHVQSNNFEAVRNITHKIRGSCKTCGADALDNELSLLVKDVNIGNFEKVVAAANKYQSVFGTDII